MNPQMGWLECQKVSDGIFPEEYAVECASADNGSFSFFVSPELLNLKEKLVRVNILDCDKEHCLVHLPHQPIEGYGRTVKVLRKYVHGL